MGVLISRYKRGHKSRCVYLGVHATICEGFFTLLHNLDIKIIPDESLLPRPLAYEILQNTFLAKRAPRRLPSPSTHQSSMQWRPAKNTHPVPKTAASCNPGLPERLCDQKGKVPFWHLLTEYVPEEKDEQVILLSTRAKLLLRQSMFMLSLQLKGKN